MLSATEKGPTSPSDWRSSGTWATPRRNSSAGRSPVTSSPSSTTLPARGCAQSGEGLHQLGLPVALHAGHGQDLARADLERRARRRPPGPVRRPRPRPVHLEHRLAGAGRASVDHQLHVVAHHQGGQALLVGLGRRGVAHHPSEAQHRDAVGEPHDLAQLVGDEDDRLAGVGEGPHHLLELGDLGGGEHGGGLVEDEAIGVAVEGLEDLGALLHARPAGPRPGRRGRRRGCSARDSSTMRARAAARSRRRRGPLHVLVAEHQVLGDGEHRHQHEVLVDHPDPGGDGVAGRVEGHLLAVDEDLRPPRR